MSTSEMFLKGLNGWWLAKWGIFDYFIQYMLPSVISRSAWLDPSWLLSRFRRLLIEWTAPPPAGFKQHLMRECHQRKEANNNYGHKGSCFCFVFFKFPLQWLKNSWKRSFFTLYYISESHQRRDLKACQDWDEIVIVLPKSHLCYPPGG